MFQNALHVEILKEKFNLKTANIRDSNNGHTAIKNWQILSVSFFFQLNDS